MAQSLWVGLSCHPHNDNVDFQRFDMCFLFVFVFFSQDGVFEEVWSVMVKTWNDKKKKTNLFTDLNVFQACSNAVGTLIIDLSASTSLHCVFFKICLLCQSCHPDDRLLYRLLSWVSLQEMGCRPPFSLSLLAR